MTESADVFVARIASLCDSLLELTEQLVLDLEVFERGFDHDVAAGKVGQVGGQSQAAYGGVARSLVELALVDLARQEVADPLARSLAARRLDLVADRVEAGLDRELRDPGAHRPKPDHPDRLDRPRHGHDARPARRRLRSPCRSRRTSTRSRTGRHGGRARSAASR